MERAGRVFFDGNCRDQPRSQGAEALKAWGRAYWGAIHPFNLEGAYVNFLEPTRPRTAPTSYGDNYKRLASIKAKYDPNNLFRVNQNIKPA